VSGNILVDIADSLGMEVGMLPLACARLVREPNFNYRVLQGAERDGIIISILEKIATDTQLVGAPERTEVWYKGWLESLEEFKLKGDPIALRPKYVKPTHYMRYKRQFICTEDPYFEWYYLQLYTQCLFQMFLKPFEYVYEFGCGTGHNLLSLSRLFPDKSCTGFDFVASSCALVNLVAGTFGCNITGELFDMAAPDGNRVLEPNSAVFTIGAIEQLGGNIEPILQYLLSQPISRCIHIEPIYEIYDKDNLADYLAMQFHRKRGYTQGLLPRLRELEAWGDIEILKVKRSAFGNLFMEGYTCIIWERR